MENQPYSEIPYWLVMGNQFRVKPTLAMLITEVKVLREVQLIGEHRNSPKKYYFVVYDRDYVINYLALNVLKPLDSINLEQIFSLLNEAFERYIELKKINFNWSLYLHISNKKDEFIHNKLRKMAEEDAENEQV